MYDLNFELAEARYLEPPEDTRRVCFCCSICGEDILEDDDYYKIGDLLLCESCINESHHYAEFEEAI